MKRLLPILGTVAALVLPLAVACTVNSTTTNPPPGNDSGPGGDANNQDGNNGDGSGQDGDTAQAYVRFANWSPDSSGIQLCFAPHGATQFSLLSDDAGDSSIPFPNVTEYNSLDVGQIDLGIAVNGSCTAPTAINTNLPIFAPNAYYTIAVVGDTTPPGGSPDHALAIVAFGDDGAQTNAVGVRFLNVAPSLTTVPLSFGQNTFSTMFAAWETNVGFATPATAGAAGTTPDANGYVVESSPSSSVAVSVEPTTNATTDTAANLNVTLSANTSTTFVLIKGATGGAAPVLMECTNDSTASASCVAQ